jgi:hypothetical protein
VRRLLALAGLAACTTSLDAIDPYPIAIDLDAGVPLLLARSPDLDPGGGLRRVVLDTASPLTIFDVGAGGVGRRRVTFELVRAGVPAVPRARFSSVQSLLSAVGAVGEGTPRPVGGVVGADALSRFALRIAPALAQIRFFPDVAGDDATQANACLASFSTPLAGGGSFVVGNDTASFLPTRIVLSVCLAPDGGDSGHDTLLVLATGVRPIVLSRSTYEALAGSAAGLPTTTLFLPGDTSGGTVARLATVNGIAIADRADHNDNSGRGACLELTASRLMTTTFCTADMTQPSPDGGPATCPCQNGKAACAVGASVEIKGSVDVAIIEDTHPLLVSLRDELRPGVADVGGLIGMQALGQLTTDVDYPGGRTIMRCAQPGAACIVRPAVAGQSEGDVRARQAELHAVYGCF